MKSSLKKQAERFLREQKNYKRWLAVFVCLAVVVTIGTTAALKYKGIAVTSDDSATEAMHMEQTEGNTDEIPEGMRRHVHTEACYEEQLVLICGMTGAGETADAGAADNGASDTDAAPEESGAADVSQGHTHSDDCYEVTGGTENLTCKIEEHTHDGDCYETKTVTETVTKTVPETVTEEVKNEDGSVSTVEKTVDKTVEETVEKEEKVLTCTKEEHTHGASCYTVEGSERTLVCGKEEGEGAAAPAVVNEEAAAAPAAVNADATAEAPAESASAAAETTAPTTTESTAAEAPAESADTEAAEAPAENADTETAGNTGAVSAENTEAAEAPAGEHVHDDSCYEPQMVLICGKEEGELEPIEPLSDEMNLVQTAETENYSVTVTYSESAMIPEEAVLQVVEYAKDSEQYIARCAELGYQPDFLLNIGFFVDGSEVEPQKSVDVKIIDKNVDNADGYEIVHFAKDGMEEVANDAAKTGEGMEMEFSTDSFTDWAGFALQSETSGNQVAEVAPVGQLAHEKTVEPSEEKDEDGNPKYYNLTLNVKGAIAESGEKAKLDIVFVVDNSGSMAWAEGGRYASGTSRRELVNRAITNLVNDLDAEKGVDAQYKLVTFSDTANTYYAGSWRSGSQLKGELPGRANGGTNYEDGLEKAGAAIGSHRENSKTIVIFLTDGAPTYYNSNNWYDGLGGDGSTTTVATVDGAKRGAGNITCNYFFAVGFGAEMTKDTTVGYSGKTAAEILQYVADGANAGTKDASTTKNLTEYFANFIESLKSIRATEVTFTDVLAPEVSIVDAEGTIVENPGVGSWTPVIKDENGVPVPLPKEGDSEEEKAKNENTLAGMTVTYDSEKGLSVSFRDGYVLKKGYTYAVTTKIAPNENADKKFEDNGYIYPDTGDKDTGSNSSDQQGIFCNTNAEVSYKYFVGDDKSTEQVVKYPFPVVQLPKEKTEPPAIVEQDMTHDKYIKKVAGADDVYDLTLDLTGRVGSTVKPAYYDIMFIVDESSSMKNTTTITTEVVDYNNLICKQKAHSHGNECYGLTCTQEEHTHSRQNNCYGLGCGKVEHTHTSNCPSHEEGFLFWWETVYDCGFDEHTHGNSCYTTLICTKAEHRHSQQRCYSLVCGEEEHQHGDSCYGTKAGSTSSVTRMKAAQEAVKSLVRSVEGNTKIIANYNLIGFGKDADSTGWISNENALVTEVNKLSASSYYTNYGAALAEAKKQLDSAPEPADASENNRAVKFVIFLTDGVPAPYGTDNPSKAYYDSAIMNAGNITSDYFYAVGLGMDGKSYPITGSTPSISKTPKEILEDVVAEVAANTKGVKEGKDGTELNKLFSDFAGILTELRCHDVTVTDTLSDYVEVNTVNVNGTSRPATLKIEIKELNNEGQPSTIKASKTGDVANGVEVEAPATTKNPESTDRVIKARYDEAAKQIVLDFPTNYKLESGYKYYVTVQIRASEEAYRQAENLPIDEKTKSPIYPNEGGPGTDHLDNNPKISEGQKGFFTNKSAEVTFVYDDSTGTETEIYQRPVIRVNPAKLTVKKTVSGLDAEKTRALLENMSFILNGDESNPIKADMSKITVQDSSETPVTYIIVTDKEVVPGTYTIAEKGGAANVEGYVRETSYKVGEEESVTPTVSDDNADIVSRQVSLDANESATVEFINNYAARTETIALKKTDQNGNSKGEGENAEGFFTGLEFLIAKGEVTVKADMTEEQLDAEAKKLPIIAKLVIGENGDAVLAESADTENTIGGKEFKLPVGTYTVIEDRTSKPLVNYNKVYPFILTVTANGQVEVGPVDGFSNKSNVKIAQPDPKDSPWKLIVVNEQMKMDELRILKVSSDSKEIKGLPGAKFDLYKAKTEESGTNIDYEKSPKLNGETPLETDGSGVIKGYDFLKNLEAGNTYYLKEVEAPAGFELQEKEIVFTVSVVRDKFFGDQIQITGVDGSSAYVVRVDGKGNYVKYDSKEDEVQYSMDEKGNKYWTLAVVNDTGAELPVTGGPGTVAYTFGGLAMIIAVSLMYGLNMRRKREKGGLN